MKYHFVSTRMAKIRKTGNNKCWQGCEKIGILNFDEVETVWPLWKTGLQFFKKLTWLLDDPAIPLPDN